MLFKCEIQFLKEFLRAADTPDTPCDTAAPSGRSTRTQPWRNSPFLSTVPTASPDAPNANAEGRDPVGDVVAIVGPRIALASARDPGKMLDRVEHEQRRSKSLRPNNPLWTFVMVCLKDSLPAIVACKLCGANGDFADAEVRLGSPTHLRQHLATNRKGHREA